MMLKPKFINFIKKKVQNSGTRYKIKISFNIYNFHVKQ